MAADFSKSVELGLKLSKRIYYGKDATVSGPPRPVVAERKSEAAESYLPTAVMVYAEITEPTVVDNPYIPSYQPYVHGRCDPPALIPLHMHGVIMEVDCYLDTAFVTVTGAWSVHCVSASESCDCRIAVPMGEEGSVLGVEVETPSKSYCTQVMSLEDAKYVENLANTKDGFLIKGQTYTLKIPQVDGGSFLSLKISWSQKLLYQDGQYCLNVPFTFPSYVVPIGKKVSEKEKILLNVNSGTGTEVFCKSSSHPLKEIRRLAGKVGFSYEREVLTWSMTDFNFSYTVSSSDICGGVLLQSPSLHDYDQREMFCFYLYPGNSIYKKIFKKEMVFLVDISASMQGDPIENAKTALLAALSMLSPLDTFNIIAFNGSSSLFSSSMELATKEVIENASEWINMNFVAEGGTNISTPLDQAIRMLSKTGAVLPIIFLITDGTVEDEKDICHAMKSHLMREGLTNPRICTFGIGSYCNHYFLKMLAEIGRGYYDAAFDIDSINLRVERFINNASSVILADITIDALEHLDSLELFSLHLPDLLAGTPLIVSGRYCGNFPDSVKVSGTLADLSNLVINAKVQKAKDVPIDKVFARRQIDALTARAWLSGSKQLEGKAAKMSMHTAVRSEYTNMILIETDKRKQQSKSNAEEENMADFEGQKIIVLRSVGIGFGNLEATAKNFPPEKAEPKLYETSTMLSKAASNVGSRLADCCCCMCFIQFCNRLNDQCAIALTQLCTALACLECLNVCCDVCDFCSCDQCC
ncbi:inter-alpha-trypsin inhibitor heavy chain-related [Forsythia ovata]|uniref:Inter-alpha-trypsin inhibitor heavy chain-related n=1 Tax=Forsythia ovata TaxID=205694 RepID=A0ABD1PER1_9LAMI